MKLSESRKEILLRLGIIKINLINTWRIETAYLWQNWANLVSTTMYTLTLVLFINILFANINNFAGYSKNEMVFFLLINQINFYFMHVWSWENVADLIFDVNQGNLDMLLTKPLPALFYVSTRKINIISVIRDGLPTVTIFACLVNWSALSFSLINLISGIVIFISGQLAFNAFLFVLASSVFKYGEAKEILGFSFPFVSHDMPYEGLIRPFRILLTTLIPSFVAAGLSTSVFLGKSNPYLTGFFAIIIGLTAMFVKTAVWGSSLKIYTSASS